MWDRLVFIFSHFHQNNLKLAFTRENMAAPTTQHLLPPSHLVYGKRKTFFRASVAKWGGVNILYIPNSYFSVSPDQQEQPLKSVPDKTREKQWRCCPKQGVRKKTSNGLYQDSSSTCPAIIFFCCALQNVSQKHWWIWQSWIHHLNSYRNSGRIFTKILTKLLPRPFLVKRCRC